jgi:hypothetical protein
MGRTGQVVTGVIVWTICVLGVATASWFAIDSAGRRVGVTPIAGRWDPTETWADTPAATSTGSGIAAPTPPATTTSGEDESTSPDPGRSTQVPPAPEVVSGSYWTDGGMIVLECVDQEINDYSIQPESGWRAEGHQESDSLLEVFFRQEDREVEVEASCASGAPVFQDVVHHREH